MSNVVRLHRYLIQNDGDCWFAYCQACSAEASAYTYPCLYGETDQPPFQLVEKPAEPPALTTAYATQLADAFWSDEYPVDTNADIIELIEQHIANRPRSQQKLIGPSEIGGECGRRIGYKLAQVEPTNLQEPGQQWRTQVGTWVHDGLAEMLAADNQRIFDSGSQFPRWLIEHRVSPGSIVIDGEEQVIYGSGDALDTWTMTVVDWKVVGPTTLKKVKAVSRLTGQPHGASQKYRIQGNVYGLGYALAGLPIKTVTIVFLPAAGELGDAYFHSESYDEQLALQYMDRLSGTAALLNSGLPLAMALDLLPTADEFCRTCPYLKGTAASLAEGCPGHAERKVRQDSFFSIVPREVS